MGREGETAFNEPGGREAPPSKAKRFKPALKKTYSDAQRSFYENPVPPDATGTVSQGMAPKGKRGEVGKAGRIDEADRAGKADKTDKTGKIGLPRLMELASGRRGMLIAACASSAASSLARLVPFFAVYLSISELVAHWNDLAAMDQRLLVSCAFAAILAALVNGMLSYLSLMLAHRAAFDILYELRLSLSRKLAKLPSGWFARTRQGELKKVLVEDVEQIEGFIGHNMPDAVAAVCTPLFAVIALAFVDWRLALLLLLPIAASFLLLGSALGSPEGAAAQVAMARSSERFNGTVVEFIHGMPAVKTFNRSLAAFRRFEDDAREFTGNVEWTARFNARGMASLYAAIGTQMLFLLPPIIFMSATAAPYEEFISTVLLFFLVGSGMKEPVLQMLVKAVSLNGINASVARIDAILQEPELKEPIKPRVPQAFDVALENVSFSYEAEASGPRALSNVSLRIPQGEVTAVVGPSGSGKSTLASLVLRFFDPQEGAVRIGGVDLRDMGLEELAKTVSFVLQDSFMFHASVEENIRMGSKASREELLAAAREAQIHEAIEALPEGYDTILGEAGAQLSGGERQRIAIARVMLRDAPIVVLDEATAYADAESEAKIQAALARLAKGKTVVVVAHRIRTVRSASAIAVLDGGRLAGFGSHEELMGSCPLYRSMVEADERRGLWTIASATAPAGGSFGKEL